MIFITASKAIVLVVDDEPLLRMMAIDLAEEAGLEALEASNADDAIKLLENRNDIRIVFTDINMPGSINGLKLAAAIRDRWPPIAIIVVSGHYAAKADELPEGSLFFSKPYPHDSVVAAFRRFAEM